MTVRSEKIAITLDKALAAKVERRRRSTGESRSAYIARAVATQTAHEEEQRKMSQYRRALKALPESDEDVRIMTVLTRKAVAALAWDDE